MADRVRHLLGLGHRRLAYLAGPPTSASNRDRPRGLHGAARRVIETAATAVVAYNDLVAFGTLSGLHQLGVRVPEDISIAGFDDIPFARYTSRRSPRCRCRRASSGTRRGGGCGHCLNGEPPEHNVYFRPRLEIRGSTGPPPRSAPGRG
ncbi:MAG: substrate-binding domain-containing protein [Jiangellaceae bacterium]